MLKIVRAHWPNAIALYIAVIFMDSLRYKFTNAPETQTIFTDKLDGWAAGLGAPGLFAQTGLFSQYVIGSAELVASLSLLLGIIPALRRFQAFGSLIGVAVMSGAISFHLFTPLGIDPNEDGGGLFVAAIGVWIGALVMLIVRRNELAGLVQGVGRAFIPGKGGEV